MSKQTIALCEIIDELIQVAGFAIETVGVYSFESTDALQERLADAAEKYRDIKTSACGGDGERVCEWVEEHLHDGSTAYNTGCRIHCMNVLERYCPVCGGKVIVKGGTE